MPITVREATPTEYGAVGRVTAGAYREFVRPDSDWEDYLARIADVAERASRTTILVAVNEDERIVGSATLELTARVEPEDDPSLSPEEAHIRMVGVAPDQRRRGIARALMVECIARARARDKRYVTLHTTARMDAAQRMYESLGFVRGPDRTFPDGFVLMGYRLDLA
ncbi:MAG TPA: GNAT family N-acetyltransferase [Actinomycetota bacterium]